MPNHLIHESSPYLLQHAHNPVNWFAWKKEAFEKAEKENKPILVSIGYSTCHWCHVMERESFEDPDTAAYMNENFVNIKVDREERPDVDQIYMEACQIITGSGGWPLNCFLTPDRRPFFAGTYYPPRPAYNRPSWLQVMQHIFNVFTNKRQVVEEQADQLTAALRRSESNFQGNPADLSIGGSPFEMTFIESIYDKLSAQFERKSGGFGGAPKFPGTMSLRFLLEYYYFTKDESAFNHLIFSLKKMIQGGIYDQIGGGFARYATDNNWLIPHFEKCCMIMPYWWRFYRTYTS